MALAAYSAGPGNVLKYGVPPFTGTHEHVAGTTAHDATYGGAAAV